MVVICRQKNESSGQRAYTARRKKGQRRRDDGQDRHIAEQVPAVRRVVHPSAQRLHGHDRPMHDALPHGEPDQAHVLHWIAGRPQQ